MQENCKSVLFQIDMEYNLDIIFNTSSIYDTYEYSINTR